MSVHEETYPGVCVGFKYYLEERERELYGKSHLVRPYSDPCIDPHLSSSQRSFSSHSTNNTYNTGIAGRYDWYIVSILPASLMLLEIYQGCDMN